jgi:histidinol-phosphatase (PHP family)
MFEANYHTHCKFCDGQGEPEDYVIEAINLGMKEIGFSSHGPLPSGITNTYCIKSELFSEYVKTIRDLKIKYIDKIKIFLGLEVDFVPGIENFQAPFLSELDYTIGSVHYVERDSSGNYWPVDADDELFCRDVNEIFGGKIQSSVEAYFSLVRQMASEKKHDIIGHLDLIKKNNFNGKYFDEKERWYRNSVLETLAVIKEFDWIVEVNTAGLRRPVKEIYPSPWIIKKCKELNIKFIVNADAHRPKDLMKDFSYGYDLLKEMGYREVYHLAEKGWQGISLC